VLAPLLPQLLLLRGTRAVRQGLVPGERPASCSMLMKRALRTLRFGSQRALLGAVVGGSKRLVGRAF
jgi:hypothetical protein